MYVIPSALVARSSSGAPLGAEPSEWGLASSTSLRKAHARSRGLLKVLRDSEAFQGITTNYPDFTGILQRFYTVFTMILLGNYGPRRS